MRLVNRVALAKLGAPNFLPSWHRWELPTSAATSWGRTHLPPSKPIHPPSESGEAIRYRGWQKLTTTEATASRSPQRTPFSCYAPPVEECPKRPVRVPTSVAAAIRQRNPEPGAP